MRPPPPDSPDILLGVANLVYPRLLTSVLLGRKCEGSFLRLPTFVVPVLVQLLCIDRATLSSTFATWL